MRETSNQRDSGSDVYATFLRLLDSEDKHGCVRFALSHLSSGSLDIPSLYEGVLAPAAREPQSSVRNRPFSIWEEHVRTSILRTVLECCYLELVSARDASLGERRKGSGIIVCPTEEYHELGARMAADLFTLQGFDVVFVGANTPQQDILDAVTVVNPVFVGVSVTSPYNLIPARRVIQRLAGLRTGERTAFTIIAGGQAFSTNPALAATLGADRTATSYNDICHFAEETPWSSR